jgi:hypothetical protein
MIDHPIGLGGAALDGDTSSTRVGSGCAHWSPCRTAARSRGSRRIRCEKRRNSLSVQFSAAPMPRVGLSRAERVCRVPKPTSRSTVARSLSSETSSTIARRLAGAAEASGARDCCAPAAGMTEKAAASARTAFS